MAFTLPSFLLGETGPSTFVLTASGGAIVGGAATVTSTIVTVYAHVAAGGANVSGVSGVVHNQVSISRITALSGSVVGGTASVGVNWIEQRSSGGAKVGGTASVFTNADYAVGSVASATSTAESGASFSDGVSSMASAVSTSEAGFIFVVEATSTGAAISVASVAENFFVSAASAASAVGDAAAYRLIESLASSAATVTGAANGQAVYYITAESLAQIVSGLQFVANFHDGWAYNLNTGAPSFYEGFKFNSFAKVGNEYFGCNDAGIFKLSGGTDNGVPIKATITTGMNGDKGIYRVDAVYAGARSESPMNLTCRVEGVEYTYAFRAATDAVEPTRVTPGKGLRGRYWQFEIANQGGAYMEIDTLEAVTAAASRRV